VRWLMRATVLALLAGACALPGLAADKPGNKPLVPETCGEYGTSLKFEKTPKDAATRAAKEEKLVFVIHVSGIFEEPDFT
jgi:hypothetical protein